MPLRHIVVRPVVLAPKCGRLSRRIPVLLAHTREECREEDSVPIEIEAETVLVPRLAVPDYLAVTGIVLSVVSIIDAPVVVPVHKFDVTCVPCLVCRGLHNRVDIALSLSLTLEQPVCLIAPDLTDSHPFIIVPEALRGIVVAVNLGLVVKQRRLDLEVERFVRNHKMVVVSQ